MPGDDGQFYRRIMRIWRGRSWKVDAIENAQTFVQSSSALISSPLSKKIFVCLKTWFFFHLQQKLSNFPSQFIEIHSPYPRRIVIFLIPLFSLLVFDCPELSIVTHIFNSCFNRSMRGVFWKCENQEETGNHTIAGFRSFIEVNQKNSIFLYMFLSHFPFIWKIYAHLRRARESEWEVFQHLFFVDWTFLSLI